MAAKRTSQRNKSRRGGGSGSTDTTLRIVGGKFRGSKLEYHGESVTRPMKDRTREAVFNLLGPSVRGGHAIDLFAGTGALGLEALSRGAKRATFVERHFPTAKVIERNIAALGVQAQCEVVRGDTFHFSRQAVIDPSLPWIIFCSPPYALFVDQLDEMLDLIATWVSKAPPGSMIAVESDRRFDVTRLPDASEWDVRNYPPAVVATRQLSNTSQDMSRAEPDANS